MPVFIMYHKWQQENTKAVARKVIEALANPPEGAAILSSHMRADQTGAVCIWQAKAPEPLKEWIVRMVPEMGTDIVPALQFFPPSPDIYSIMHVLIS
jgi:hypothetical protein